eukprot:1913275-Pyramimonas_sp.AAC.1
MQLRNWMHGCLTRKQSHSQADHTLTAKSQKTPLAGIPHCIVNMRRRPVVGADHRRLGDITKLGSAAEDSRTFRTAIARQSSHGW